MSNVDLLNDTLARTVGIVTVSHTYAKVRQTVFPQVELTVSITYIVTKDGHRHIVANVEPN